MPIIWRKVEAGAGILLYAALGTKPESMLQGGQYIDGLGRPVRDSERSERIRALRQADEKWSRRLWAVSILLLRDSPFEDIIAESQLDSIDK